MESNKEQMLVMPGDISTDIQFELHPLAEIRCHKDLPTADGVSNCKTVLFTLELHCIPKA